MTEASEQAREDGTGCRSPVIEADGEQIGGFLGKSEGGDAALGPVHLLRVLGILERPEEDEPVPLLRELELPIPHRQHVRLQLVPASALGV